MTDALERLIAEQPHFHAWPDGRPANWSVAADVLRLIARRVAPGMRTLETGAGHTTAAFAIAGADHVAVTPDREQAERIAAWLADHGVAASPRFIHESSDVALPAGAGLPETVDFALIDGAHRFPFAMLDWHYIEARVPVGGIVGVDDIHMPSVRILYDFLAGESDWRLVEEFAVTAFFERVAKRPNKWDWADQDMNRAFHERVTAGLVAEPAGDGAGADADGAGTRGEAQGDRAAVIDLRGAKLQMKSLSMRIRALERDVEASQHMLRKTREELWAIKNSRSWRLISALREAVRRPARALRRRLGGA